MRIKEQRAILISSLSFIFTQTTAAQVPESTPIPVSTSMESNRSILDSLSETLHFSYYGFYHGGALSGLGKPYQPRVDGSLDETSPQTLESLVTTGYKINPNIMTGVVWHFNYTPISDTSAWNGHSLQMLDPLLTVSHSRLLKSERFNLSGKINVALPMSSDDVLKQNHLATYIQPALSANYNFPESNVTIGIYGYVRGYIPTTQSVSDYVSYKVFAAPNLTYQISSKVAATLWIDLIQATRRHRSGVISGLQNEETDIEPGISWDITEHININPAINIYPGHATLASTSLIAFVTARAF